MNTTGFKGLRILRHAVGPGLIVATAGIGASDVMAATLAGATHGERLLWAVAAGAAAKFALADRLNVMRHTEDATFCAVLRRETHRVVLILLAAYLAVWCVMVGAALMGGCGLVIEHISGGRIPSAWGGWAHAPIAAALTLPGHTEHIGRVMRALVVIMIVAMAGCALATFAPSAETLRGLFVPGAPENGLPSVLSVLGGIGGTVTLLAYDHERREHDKSRGVRASLGETRADLGFAYGFTALFGMAVMILACEIFFRSGIVPENSRVIPEMAKGLARVLGPAGAWIFPLGFWAAACASMLGVWKTVPVIFADCVAHAAKKPEHASRPGVAHHIALGLLTLAPLPLMLLAKPVGLIVAFTLLGGVFIPLLAGTMLALDLRLPKDHPRKSGPVAKLVSVATLALFLAVGAAELLALLRRH